MSLNRGRSRPFGSIAEALRQQAVHTPVRPIFHFLRDGVTVAETVTFAELDGRAQRIAAWLNSRGAAGTRAIMAYPPGLDFIAAFFGCLYAGVIAIPLPPPDTARLKRSLPRIAVVAADADASFLLSVSGIAEPLAEVGAGTPLAGLTFFATDRAPEGNADPVRVTAEDIAYLQYTSGSTSDPKGVIVAHGNITANLDLLYNTWNYGAEGAVAANWMPNFHDYGLVEGILEPVWAGVESYQMSPVGFLKNPFRWLGAISTYKVTNSGGPNFAFDHCVDRYTPERAAGLDLSSWRVAHSGAEPIRKSTIDAFCRTFAPHGFDRRQFYPSYGLAEATLMVATRRADTPALFRPLSASKLERDGDVISTDVHPRWVADCGSPAPGVEIVIVDPATFKVRPDGTVGEIWIRHPSVSRGYWRKPAVNEEIFAARTSDGQGPFMRTGDLGFLMGGGVSLTGRLKDLVIVDGVNHYPNDIEQTVEEAHPALRKNAAAVFAIDTPQGERVAVTVEVESRDIDAGPIFTAIRGALSEHHDLETAAIVLIKKGSIAKTTSGKIQRRAMKEGYLAGTLQAIAAWHRDERPPSAPPAASASRAIETWLTERIASRFGITPVPLDAPFATLGLSSRDMVTLAVDLEEHLGVDVPPTLFWSHPTVTDLARSLDTPRRAVAAPSRSRPATTEPVAIVGIGCRFPGARGPEAFWRLLLDKVDAVTAVPTDRWDPATWYAPEPATPGKTNSRWGGFIDGIDRFDPLFFGLSPREAAPMDPQQRLALTVSWEALENAGIAPDRLRGSSGGVFIGVSSDDYARLQFDHAARTSPYAGVGAANALVANRISYALDLSGPSMAIDTACSSSLVAVHLAVRALRNGDCDLALAGGVNAILTPHVTVALSQARMMASDGRCKTFDAAADGYVRGEGCGIVVLKRLSDAIADGDRIEGVILGSAVNQDGKSNGQTAPNGNAQRRVIAEALADAHVAPGNIGFVETHGTGTPLGDPVEVEALVATLGEGRTPGSVCRLGALKTNIGHLESAAGIAGLIKATLAVRHGIIPANLHLKRRNPLIRLDEAAFALPADSTPWEGDRIAGVSSFGFGGTNAHVIVAAGPDHHETPRTERSRRALTVSAESDTALVASARRIAGWLAANPAANLDDVAATLNTGRSALHHRAGIVAGSREEAIDRLNAVTSGNAPSARPKIAFLYTGQGVLYPGAAHRLYESAPVFRAALDEIGNAMGGPFANVPGLLNADETRLSETAIAQPWLFALQFALTRLWAAWGVTPAAVVGHSIGEYMAATAAGVFTPADAARLLVERGRLTAQLPAGRMLAVMAGPEIVEPLVAEARGEISVASYNGKNIIVLSGTSGAVDEAARSLRSKGITAKPLALDRAFHSPMMEPLLHPFAAAAERVTFAEPVLPFFSTVTGKAESGLIATPGYWGDHIVRPVRFADTIACLAAEGFDTFVEIGPDPALIPMAKRCVETRATWLPSLRRGDDEWASLLSTAVTLFENGAPIDWRGVDLPYASRRLSLPTYPFEEQRCWTEPSSHPASPAAGDGPFLGEPVSIADRPGSRIWQAQFTLDDAPWLAGHEIDGNIVFPAACYTDMAFAAARTLGLAQPWRFAKVSFDAPLTIDPDEPVTLQTIAHPDGDGYRISFYSYKNNHYLLHASGTISRGDTPDCRPGHDQPAGRAESGEAFYTRWRERGNRWSGAFAGITDLSTDGECVIAHVSPAGPAAGPHGHIAHPGLLDSLGQPMAALAGEGDGAFVGRAFDAFTLCRPLAKGPFTSIVRRVGTGNGTVTGSVTVLDAAGEVVATIDRLVFTFVNAFRSGTMNHVLRWRSTPLPETGIPCHLAGEKGDLRAGATPAGSFAWVIDGTDETRLAGRLAEVAKQLEQSAGSFHLVIDNGFGTSTDTLTPAASAFLAFARTAAMERPDRWKGAIVTGTGHDPNSLPAALAAGGDGALSAGGFFRPRLVPVTTPRKPVSLRPEGAYLITGGLGALGLEAARWLAARGARRLILMTRTGLPPRNQWRTIPGTTPIGVKIAAVRELERLGVTVGTPAIDVADRQLLAGWLAQRDAEDAPPVAGLIHAAGSVATAYLHELTEQNAAPIIAGKADGAAALAGVFSGRGLDFILFYGSLSGLVGSPGLGAYAAANGYLDGLARTLRGRGEHAVSIGWGAFRGNGLAAGMTGSEEDPFGRLDPAGGTAALDQLIHANEPAIGHFAADWPAVLRRYPALAENGYLDELITPAAAPARTPGIDRNGLVFLAIEHRIAPVTAWLSATVGARLRIEGGFSATRPLTELGLDSLTALEIRNAVETAFGVRIGIVDLMRGSCVAELAERIAREVSPPAPAVTPGTSSAGPFPLSAGQRAVWLIDGMTPSSAYHVSFAARILSPIDPEAMRAAATDLAARHPMLRARFIPGDDGVTQRIADEIDIDYRLVDASGWDEPTLAAAMKQAYDEPFDLVAGPMLRLRLFRRSASETAFLLAVHHIVCDGWSLWILLDELGALYAARADGIALDIPQIPATFADAVQREQTFVTGAAGAAELAWWRERLADPPPPLELIGDRPRPPVARHHGATCRFITSGTLARDISALAGREKTTLFAVTLTAFHLLLSRLSGVRRIAVGVPSTGREEAAFAPVVGDFVNPVLIEAAVDPDLTFLDLLARVKDTSLAALGNSRYPFPLLVEHLRLPRDPARSPLFDAMFVFQKPQQSAGLTSLFIPGISADSVSWGGMQLQAFDLPQQEGQLEITLEVVETAGVLAGTIKYDTDRFDAPTADRIARRYHALLEQIAADPSRPVVAYDLRTVEEAAVITRTNETAASSPEEALLHRRFTATAQAGPERIAVIHGEHQLTYGVLDRRSDAVAAALRAVGARPGRIVGVTAPRSVETIVALLGVMKSGAAYLPLDPGYPGHRLSAMIADANPVAIVNAGGTALATLLPAIDVAAVPDAPPPADLAPAPGDPAYLIYTSGSTGRPKGVVVTHANLAASTHARSLIYGPAGRFLMLSSFSFDSSVAGTFWSLAYGGTLILPPDRYHEDIDALARLISDRKATHLLTLPSLYQTLLATAPAGTLSSLTTAVVAGEPCTAAVGKAHHAVIPYAKLYNEYGPTEGTVWATVHRLGPDERDPVPIGLPIPNVFIRILDDAGRPVPLGVAGEIHIGGAQVAAGYHGDPTRTASAFVPDPEGTGRLYRTGDRAYYRSDGSIVFIGRNDGQVKLRGYRIEIGDIEAAVRSLPGVTGAAVKVRGDRLIGYAAGDHLDAEALKRATGEQLPEYMVPAQWVILDHLPTGATGKIDRDALPDPTSTPDAAPPEGETESFVADIWRDVLGLPRVSATENFFDIGGHSILLARVHAKLARRFDVKLVDLYRYPTIRALSARIDAGSTAVQASSAASAGRLRAEARRGSRTRAVPGKRGGER
ncbi:MAG TPA: amino acid adenylation domain-containing protein [Candidatus Ozemobacteraceae bacterium]|nr:amino acid adenylation domain-containing protein [Candidatus Ozemobacteraceae bacterium]